jgi:YggT family protein
MDVVLEIACLAIEIYWVILLVRIILSWVPSLPAPVLPIANFVRAATDPLMLPLRGLIPPVQMGAAALDLSPLILIFAVSIIRSLLCS